MPHSFTDILIHAVFSTQDRAATIGDEIRPELLAYMGGVIRKIGGKALLINGPSDHVHMLVRLPANMSVAELLRMVKANSSKWVAEKWPERPNFAWQSGYAAFSVSLSKRDQVYQYIRDQQLHHKNVSFADEIRALFRKHGADAGPFLD
jgi:putative transposase